MRYRLVAWGTISLAPDTLVLPVHVHVFSTTGTVEDHLSRRSVAAWFDQPDLYTHSQRVTPDPSQTELITDFRQTRFVRPIDPIWVQAGVQFKMASYEVIDDDDLAFRLTNLNETRHNYCTRRDTRLFEYVKLQENKPGVHIYVGGRINPWSTEQLLADIPGATCWPLCIGQVGATNHILLDKSLGANGRAPLALAHELGHFLGLGHPQGSLSCEGPLIDGDGRDNLMNPGLTGTNLQQRQIQRARSIACDYLRSWHRSGNSIALGNCP